MAHKLFNCCAFAVTVAPYTGDVTIGAAMPDQLLPAAAGAVDGDLSWWRLEDGLSIFEVFEGVYNAGPGTITRGAVIVSSAGGARVSGSIASTITNVAPKEAFTERVGKTGDTMTGPLAINIGAASVTSFSIISTGSHNPQLSLYDTTDGGWTAFSQSGKFNLAKVNSGGAWVSNALTIDTSGNVGFGTTSPTYRADLANFTLSSTAATQTLSQRWTVPDGNTTFIDLTSTRLSTGGDWTTAEQRLGRTVDVTNHHWIGWGYNNGGESFKIGHANSTLVLVDYTGRVGIGTTAPGTSLVVSQNAYAPPTPVVGSLLQIVGVDGSTARASFDAFGGNPQFAFRRANGSAGSLGSGSVVTTGQAIGSLTWWGHDGTAYGSAASGSLNCFAYNTWSTSDHSTFLTFTTTPSGSTTATERMRIDSAGNVGFGTGSPWQPVSVNGTGTAGVFSSARQVSIGASSTYSLNVGYFQSASAAPFAGVIQALDNGSGTILALNPSGGNVGIGGLPGSSKLLVLNATAGVTALSVDGVAGNLLVDFAGGGSNYYDASFHVFRNFAGTELMRLNSTGLGINTTGPNYSLDVNGIINAQLGLRIGPANVGAYSRATLQSMFNLDTIGSSAFAWNYSSGGGELDLFINRDGGSIGGLRIYDFPNTSGNPTGIFTVLGSGYVGIGTLAPGTNLVINGNATGAPTPIANSIFQLVGADATAARAEFTAFAANGGFLFRRANGTAASPTQLINGSQIGAISFWGYDSSGWTTGAAATVSGFASTSWTSADHGSYVTISSTKAGATSNTERVRVSGTNGYFLVNTTTESTALTVGGALSLAVPSTINAATYTLVDADSSLIFTTTNCTVTLPAASSYLGRILHVKNVTANSVTSASSNVVPLGSATAGTAILAATAGKFAMLQSDGTNWITMMAN